MVNFALYLSYRCSHFVLLGGKKTKQKYYCDVYLFVLKVPNYSKVFKHSYFLVPFVTSRRVLAPLKSVGTTLYGPQRINMIFLFSEPLDIFVVCFCDE